MAMNKIIPGAALVGVGAAATLSNTPAVGTTLAKIAGVSTGVLASLQDALASVGLGGTAGALAPFAAPVVGGFAGYSLAKNLGIENKLARTAVGVIPGAGAGAALLGAGGLAGGLAPFILIGGSAYAGYKTLQWTWGKIKPGKSS